MVALPASAAMNLYQAPNGQLVLEATDCQNAQRLAKAAGLPDDDDPPQGGGEGGSTEKQTLIQEGVQTVLQAVLGDDQPAPKRERTFKLSDDVTDKLTADNFEEYQAALISYVQDVNWKTKLYITWRDYSIFRRLKMACTGVNQITKPFRVSIEAYTGSLDNAIEQASDEAVDKLAQGARAHSFADMAKLSIVGWEDAIDQKNPFLLLALDEETYSKLTEYEPRIATLFEDMYTFFKIRAVLLDNEYNENIDELIRVSKIGKGKAFDTWHILAQFAKKMLNLSREGKLSPEDEKDLHIWRLQSAMAYVKENVEVEKRAADLAVKNPQNASLVEEVKQGPKKKPSLDEKAQELLQKMTQEEIKNLIRKYKGK